MKTSVKHFALISLMLAGISSAVAANANNISVRNTNSSSPVVTDETTITNQHLATATTQKSTANKKTLAEDSRGLSAFFILGIVINIIMAVTFAWWFSKEWRKSKVKGDDK